MTDIVKRYGTLVANYGMGHRLEMEESPYGMYVYHSDYSALSEERDRLVGALEQIQRMSCVYADTSEKGKWITRMGDEARAALVGSGKTAESKSLLHSPNDPPPAGCYCKPGQCMAPVIMGRQMPCRDPEKAKAPKCDCWKHERQVCDICQGVSAESGKEPK